MRVELTFLIFIRDNFASRPATRLGIKALSSIWKGKGESDNPLNEDDVVRFTN